MLLPLLVGVGQKVLGQLIARSPRAPSWVAGLTWLEQPMLLLLICNISFRTAFFAPLRFSHIVHQFPHWATVFFAVTDTDLGRYHRHVISGSRPGARIQTPLSCL